MLLSEFDLPERSEHFCQYLAIGFPPTTAATMASFSLGAAAKLMARSDIRAYLLALSQNCLHAVREAERRDAAKEAMKVGGTVTEQNP